MRTYSAWLGLTITLIVIVFATNCKKKTTPTPSNPPVVDNDIPIVMTSPVAMITDSSAISGYTLISPGDGTILAAGVCWDTIPNPTVSGNKTNNYQSSGTSASTISGLKTKTTYYVRAYATNVHGTGYGIEMSFTTPNTKWTLWSNGINAKIVNTFLIAGSDMYVGTSEGIYKSPAGQNNWTFVSNLVVYSFVSKNGDLFAATSSGVHLSNTGGSSWTAMNSGIKVVTRTDIAQDGSNLFITAGTAGHEETYLSTNHGSSWSIITPTPDLGFSLTKNIEAVNGAVFVEDYGAHKLFKTVDNGTTWTGICDLPNTEMIDLVSIDQDLYACYSSGLYLAGGPSLTKIGNLGGVQYICKDKNTLYIAAFDGVYSSADKGSTWLKMEGLPALKVNTLKIHQGFLYAALYSNEGTKPIYRTKLQ